MWQQVEDVLSNPATVLTGLKALDDESAQSNLLEQELVQVDKCLRAIDKEQEQLQ